MELVKKYAHVMGDVVYSIDDKPFDHKADKDIEITIENCPYIDVSMTSDSGNNSQQYSFKYYFLDEIEPGDKYTDGKFTINNTSYDDGLKIDSYFEYKQYKNAKKIAEELNAGTLTCETKYNNTKFYFLSQSGKYTVAVGETNTYHVFNAGEFNYEVTIKNDTTDEFQEINLDLALGEIATTKVNEYLSICKKELKKTITSEDIKDI